MPGDCAGGAGSTSCDCLIILDWDAPPWYAISTMEVGILVRRALERRWGRLHNHLGIIIEIDGSQHCKVVWMNNPKQSWLIAFDLLEYV